MRNILNYVAIMNSDLLIHKKKKNSNIDDRLQAIKLLRKLIL